MKLSFFIPLTLILISSCTQDASLTPRERIIEVQDGQGYAVGMGVILDQDTLMTARHVYDACGRDKCVFSNSSVTINPREIQEVSENPKDAVKIEIMPLSSQVPLRTVSPALSENIYALVSRSGSWQRIDGKVLSLDASYIGYSDTLSGMIYTGALETDIVLEKGESGTPVWSLSGELIGIMSAVDPVGKRGWIVK